MKIGVLGSGMVGQPDAERLAGLWHDAMIGACDIQTARGAELYLPLWLYIFGPFDTGLFNARLVKR